MNSIAVNTMPVINIIDYSSKKEESESCSQKTKRRAKGEGSIRKKGNTYEGRVTVKIKGKSQQISICDPDKKMLIKKMAEAISQSDDYKYVKKKRSKLQNVDIKGILSEFEGIFQFWFFCNINNPSLLYYDNKPVQTFCWITKLGLIYDYSNDAEKHYFQIDTSFYALTPYTYCVPLFIIDNASLPLGLVIGPSEHSNLFLEFFDLLEKYNSTFITQKFKILSD